MDKFIFIIVASLVGISAAIQGPVNVKLGIELGSSYWSAILSFLIAFLAGSFFLIIIGFYMGDKVPSLEVIKGISLWKYLGGLCGVIYVFGLIIAIPKLGVGTTTTIVLFSQLLVSVLIDHFGFFGVEVKLISFSKIMALLLMSLSIFLISRN